MTKKTLFIDLLYIIKADLIFDKILMLFFLVKLKRLEIKCRQKINFVPQGNYNLNIIGDLSKFIIHKTSHLKSDTLIECSGGVQIGKYFHTGKGLTIFSTNHNFDNGTKIPYDTKIIYKPVKIDDFVWCGANVTILPGVTIGEGAIIGGGSVVTRNVEPCSIVGGNPAKELRKRNVNHYLNLKKNGKFF